MSNIGFLYIDEKKFPLDRLNNEINLICKEKLKDKVYSCINQINNSIFIMLRPNIFIVKLKYYKGVLEFDHETDFALQWVEAVIKNELSYKFNALIGDEGIGDETWIGTKDRYNTYYDYLKKLFGSKCFEYNKNLKKKALVSQVDSAVKKYGDLFSD